MTRPQPEMRRLERRGADPRPLLDLPAYRVTQGAPHVRDGIDLNRIQIWILLALSPSILIGLYNTGLQANRAMSESVPGSGGWRVELLARLGIANDSASILDCLSHGILYGFPAFVVSLTLAWFWAILFAKLRGRPTSNEFVVTAAIFTLLLPPHAPLWQVALGLSFGVVLGKEVFGGTGKNFLHPALVGLVFLHLAYSGTLRDEYLWRGLEGYAGTNLFGDIHTAGAAIFQESGLTWRDSLLGFVQGPMGSTSALAAGLGALLLIRLGIVSWRTMAGVLVGAAATLLALRWWVTDPGPLLTIPPYWHLTLGSLGFGIAFLAADPVTSATTQPGRWVYGILIGFMVVLIRSQHPLHPDGVVLAILLGNVFAPLIDSFFVWTSIRRRKHALEA